MKALIVGLALVACGVAPGMTALAQERGTVSAPEAGGQPEALFAQAVREVIAQQIDAFRRDDFVAAFALASVTIRTIFGTPEAFGRMVREGYPMVHRPDTVDFDAAGLRNGRFTQRVRITDGAGRSYLLEYEFVAENGEPRINGVRILPPADVGV